MPLAFTRAIPPLATFLFVSLAGLATPLLAQQGEARTERAARPVDPYTKGDPQQMARLGYHSFGPFGFGHKHTTEDVESLLGLPGGILWVETEHFRLGCRLANYPIPRENRDETKKIRRELKQLAKRLPAVRPTVKSLDPWLRLHLFAQRLEWLYRDVARRLEPVVVTMGDDGKPLFGHGQYLGMPRKFTVLLVESASVAINYFQTCQDRRITSPTRHYDIEFGSMLFVTANEFIYPDYRGDTGLHCSVAFNIAHNLVTAYRGYRYALPNWWAEGVGHWYARSISAYHVQAQSSPGMVASKEEIGRWAPRLRRRARVGTLPAAAEFCEQVDGNSLAARKAMFAWSLVDCLMAKDPAGFGTFMLEMKRRAPPWGVAIEPTQIAEWQRDALQAAWQLDFDQLQNAWAKHARRYPKR